ncbi:MAG TPA: hypothetical protein DC040_04470, partial [Deltaproteobacteria bacterium]|nr:hypothetical protein [Deltaproteobacteria bacterium]
GISKIFIHRFAGILSAYGMGLADIVVEIQEPSVLVLAESSQDKSLKILLKKLDKLAENARTDLVEQGYKPEQIEIKRYLNLRYQGTDTALMVPEPEPKNNYDTGITNCGLGIAESSPELQKN